jgi:hypothetical protein
MDDLQVNGNGAAHFSSKAARLSGSALRHSWADRR